MPVEYSPAKVDLYFPARRGLFFRDTPADNEAALCAEMARLTYLRAESLFSFDQPAIAAILRAQGFSSVSFYESKDKPDGSGSHCFLAKDVQRNLAVVAFRGTDADDHTDIFDDGDLLQIQWKPGGRVHKGFADALADVQTGLLDGLSAADGKVVYTGHSLGAAMATLLASLRTPDHLYTIGSPCVGDADFVQVLTDAGIKSSRYVDCCDMVTRVPPPIVPGLGSYQHFGPMTYIAADRSMPSAPDDDFIQKDRLAASAEYILKFGWKQGNVAVRELADHAPINYVAALNAAPLAIP